MAEECLGGICHSIYQYAKTNKIHEGLWEKQRIIISSILGYK